VFGSTVRGDARPDSDIDIRVEVERGRTLLDVIALEQYLEELLGRAVEVLTDAGLSPYLQQHILIEAASAVKDDRVYLQHIRDALDDIAAYCGSDRDGFFSDRMRQDATLRKLEVT